MHCKIGEMLETNTATITAENQRGRRRGESGIMLTFRLRLLSFFVRNSTSRDGKREVTLRRLNAREKTPKLKLASLASFTKRSLVLLSKTNKRLNRAFFLFLILQNKTVLFWLIKKRSVYPVVRFWSLFWTPAVNSEFFFSFQFCFRLLPPTPLLNL